jgi:hypothetical protein
MCLFLQYADWCTHISLTLSENQELFWDTAMRMTRSIESWSLKWRRHSIKNRQKYNAYRCDVLKRKVKWESSLKHKNGCKAHLGVMLVEISETLCWWFSYSVQAPLTFLMCFVVGGGGVFDNTGVWTQASHFLGKCSTTWAIPHDFVALVCFSGRVLLLPGARLGHDPLTSASHVTGITDVHYHAMSLICFPDWT